MKYANYSDFESIQGMLVWCFVDKPVKAYSIPRDTRPDEYRVGVVITSEQQVDKLAKFAKSVNSLISLKRVETTEFEDKYKTKPPKDAGKAVWILTVRKSTVDYESGLPLTEDEVPKIYLNGTTELPKGTLVENGSYGVVRTEFVRNSLRLKSVNVQTLIEYKPV